MKPAMKIPVRAANLGRAARILSGIKNGSTLTVVIAAPNHPFLVA